MLDVLGSLKNVQFTTQQHYEDIKAQKPFARIWAVQFELAYSDFRTVQTALQLANETDLLKRYTAAYNAVYNYEYAYVEGGLDGFNQKYSDHVADYEAALAKFQEVLKEVFTTQPDDDAPGLV